MHVNRDLNALVACGPRGASVGGVTDLLWPEAEGFDAYRALITTLHRLRRLLVHRQAVQFAAGRLRIDPAVCGVDAWTFEQALANARDREQLAAALALYRGPFLADEHSPWVLGMRSRLEQNIARVTRRLWAQAGIGAPKHPSVSLIKGEWYTTAPAFQA